MYRIKNNPPLLDKISYTSTVGLVDCDHGKRSLLQESASGTDLSDIGTDFFILI